MTSIIQKTARKPRSLIILISTLLYSTSAPAADFSFEGNTLRVLDFNAESSTGLESIYVAYDLQGVSISYSSATPVKWYRFTNLGGAFAEEITSGVLFDGHKSTLTDVSGDCGYIVECDGRQHCIWIVEYAPKRLSLQDIRASANSDCDATILEVVGSGEAIHYFTILGQQRTLSREIHVNYDTLLWNEEEQQYTLQAVDKELEYLREEVSIIPAALCPTVFTISGDRFLQAWNWEQKKQSTTIQPVAVEVHASSKQSEEESSIDLPSNIIKTEDSTNLGGSAPITIDFMAWVTDGVKHTEWQMAQDSGFETIDYRFTEQDLSYTFTEEGTYFLRFIGSNSDGSCSSYSDTFTVTIGASELRIPNVFSPNGDGINDEWKVAYRSLISFECWIFDRYGNQLKHLTSPDQGWDGKRGGKTVPSGVYYYVIQAKGADGREYKESGDINIIRTSVSSSSSIDTE